MSIIDSRYNERRYTPSDINEHLETLYTYARECETIAEFGVRNVVSSYALAKANPKKLICVDINTNYNIDIFKEECKRENVNMRFDQASTLEYDLEEVDMLFIDTLHTYDQVLGELERHHSKVKKYILFHDTITFGTVNEDGSTVEGRIGLVPAIKLFLSNHKEWKEVCTYTNNNGLTIIKRES
jgi:hypothetical protein